MHLPHRSALYAPLLRLQAWIRRQAAPQGWVGSRAAPCVLEYSDFLTAGTTILRLGTTAVHVDLGFLLCCRPTSNLQ